jgi:hypothetical protein
MNGIVEELLRLERAKQKALIEGDAPAYDEAVRAQLHALDSTPNLEADARLASDELATLAKVIRLNAALFWNLMSVSPAFERSRSGYNARGTVETQVAGRIQVEA